MEEDEEIGRRMNEVEEKRLEEDGGRENGEEIGGG